jgi:hypothetical protein
MFPFVLAASLAAASAGAPAQAADAGVEYRSAFEGFHPWRPEEPRDWREVNDEVERLGGHAGHLRAAPPAAIKTPAPPVREGNTPAAGEPKK